MTLRHYKYDSDLNSWTFICDDCGSVVVDNELHFQWHKELDQDRARAAFL